MTDELKLTIVAEEDPWIRLIQLALDPSSDPARIAAYAEFFEHDLPDFDGWLQDVRAASASIYPSQVVLVGTQEELRERLPEADVVVVESLRIDAADLALGTRLQVVQKFGTIMRNVDAQACSERGLELLSLRRRANIGCAEHTLAMMLALARKFPRIANRISFEQLQEAGYSPKLWDRRYTGATSGWARVGGLQTLYESTQGIVGMGEIGREQALRSIPFGMRTLYYQRTRLSPEEEATYQVEYASLPDLLAQSDFVSIQLPGNASTENLINAEQLAMMKPGAILVNTSRPLIVNRDALLESLRSGRLGALGLDTLYDVPGRSDDELLGFDNVLLTPWTAAQPRFNALNDLRQLITGLAVKFPA